MRSTEDRDALGALPSKYRLHIDVCRRTRRAVVTLAHHAGISQTEALCRLVAYGAVVADIARGAPLGGVDAVEIAFDNQDWGVLVAPRRRRRWWHVRARWPIVGRSQLVCDASHTDNRLTVEY